MALQATPTHALVDKATMNGLNLLATFLWKCSFSASQSKGLNDQKSLPKDKAKRHLKLQSPVVKTCIICPNRISPQAQPYCLVSTYNGHWPGILCPPKGYHSHCSHKANDIGNTTQCTSLWRVLEWYCTQHPITIMVIFIEPPQSTVCCWKISSSNV